MSLTPEIQDRLECVMILYFHMEQHTHLSSLLVLFDTGKEVCAAVINITPSEKCCGLKLRLPAELL